MLCVLTLQNRMWHRIHYCLASSASSDNNRTANLSEYFKYIYKISKNKSDIYKNIINIIYNII